ncbi:MAG: AAA family ATPase [Infirmifilum sp.]
MAVNDNVKVVRERLLAVEKALNSVVVGHEDMVSALLYASIAGEHVVFISPPGTAKTFLVKTFARLVNAQHYAYLLTKFTSYDEVFGAVDVASLAQGSYKRNWSRLISAEVVFLDEVFKANSAILNALLSLLQERIIYDPLTGSEVKAALHVAIGASNEIPEDGELQALYDRFALRVFSDYLNDDVLLLKALEARWANNNGFPTAVASMDDVRTLHNYAVSLLTMVIKDFGAEVWRVYHTSFVPFIKQLRLKGVLVSDRTVIEKLPKLFASYLVLRGVTLDNVMNAPYDLLPLLAHSPAEKAELMKALEESLGELAELSKKLEDAKKLLRAMDLASARKKLQEILDYDVSTLSSKPWLKPRAEAILSSARDYMARIESIMAQLGVGEEA